jgi:hypothetical protein
MNTEYLRHKQEAQVRNTSKAQLRQLLQAVTDVAVSVHASLGADLPKSIYQLALLKQLSKYGLQLETDSYVLKHADGSEMVREVITIEGCLVIECVTGADIIEVCRGRTQFDVEVNAMRAGLIIVYDRHLQLYRLETREQSGYIH